MDAVRRELLGVALRSEPHVLFGREALREVLARHDIRVCGPNCLGTVSVHQKAALFPQASFRDLQAGSIGCVFQSGGILQYVLRSLL